MEDEDLDWEIEMETTKNSSSKLGWILNTGFNLGKKFVITGVVISSAPIVLPPLIVVSALGFAVSVPFGFIFASYACTQKLMSKLLPSEAEEEIRYEIQNDGLIDYIENHEDLGANEYEEELSETIVEEDGKNNQESKLFKDNKEEIEIGDNVVYMDEQETDHVNINNENVEIQKIVTPQRKGKGKQEKARHNNSKGKKSSTTTPMATDKPPTTQKSFGNKKRQDAAKRREKETKPSVESDSKLSQVKKPKLEDETNDTTDEISPSLVLVEAVIPNEKGYTGNEDSKRQGMEDAAVVSEVSYQKKDENSKSTVDVLEVEVETTKEYYSEGMIIEETTTYSVEVKQDEEIPEANVKNVHSDEGVVSDEKIWKEIDAIRMIVGFNAPRKTSYFEELKSLYLFTGIEPPPSLVMGSPDVAEFYSKLRFLKLVIGVK